MITVFSDALVFDGHCAKVGGPRHVVVEDGRIREVASIPPRIANALEVKCGRRHLMPGQETAARGVYVMAHCHTDDGAARCAALGIRSVEHGTLIERDETARALAAAGTFVVPTLSVGAALDDPGESRVLSEYMAEKNRAMGDRELRAIEVCRRNGVKLGLGTDLFDYASHPRQSGELELRGRVERPIDVLRSATSVNAELLQLEGKLGVIAAGAHADLLVLDFDPFADLSQFRHPQRIPVVMQAGQFVRNAL